MVESEYAIENDRYKINFTQISRSQQNKKENKTYFTMNLPAKQSDPSTFNAQRTALSHFSLDIWSNDYSL